MIIKKIFKVGDDDSYSLQIEDFNSIDEVISSLHDLNKTTQPEEKHDAHLSVQMTNTLKNQIRHVADVRGATMSDIAREALNEYLNFDNGFDGIYRSIFDKAAPVNQEA